MCAPIPTSEPYAMKNETEFTQELTALINKHGIDAYTNTADFIVARYVVNTLHALWVRGDMLQRNQLDEHTVQWNKPATAPAPPAECTRKDRQAGSRFEKMAAQVRQENVLESLVDHLVDLQRDGLRPTLIFMNETALERLIGQSHMVSEREALAEVLPAPEAKSYFLGVPIKVCDVFGFTVMTEPNRP